jgi:hypothetical protein
MKSISVEVTVTDVNCSSNELTFYRYSETEEGNNYVYVTAEYHDESDFSKVTKVRLTVHAESLIKAARVIEATLY